MTEKLYDQDAYAVEFDAKVISCEAYQEKKESGYHVILDRTLFFPEEGGQSPDKGTIDGIEVTDVYYKLGSDRVRIALEAGAGAENKEPQ